MIKTFGNKDTKQIFEGHRVKSLPQDMQEKARQKLWMISAADTLNDLKVPPGNRLEKLHSPSLPEWSIRINDQWGIVFDFENGDAFWVEIMDYHNR